MPLSVNPSTPRLSSETQGHLIGTGARNHGQNRNQPQCTRRSRRTICKVSLVPILLVISSLLPDFLPQGLRGCTSPGTHFALKVTHIRRRLGPLGLPSLTSSFVKYSHIHSFKYGIHIFVLSNGVLLSAICEPER